MAKLRWTDSALEDLNRIADYIALDNETAASKLVTKIFSIIERLITYPESGRIPPELQNSVYREVIVDPCRIFYRINNDNIYVLHVMRGEQKLRKYLLDERKKKIDV